MNEPQTINEILDKAKTIAVIGLSDKPGRASFGVSNYMQRHGYRILPVNPQAVEILGESCYPTLDDAYEAIGKIDLVNVFRAPEFIPEIVKDVIRLRIPHLWLQEGVIHDEAAGWAEAAGIKVVMDRCIYKEHARLRG
jgi:predicted CoA-binding protein